MFSLENHSLLRKEQNNAKVVYALMSPDYELRDCKMTIHALNSHQSYEVCLIKLFLSLNSYFKTGKFVIKFNFTSALEKSEGPIKKGCHFRAVPPDQLMYSWGIQPRWNFRLLTALMCYLFFLRLKDVTHEGHWEHAFMPLCLVLGSVPILPITICKITFY